MSFMDIYNKVNPEQPQVNNTVMPAVGTPTTIEATPEAKQEATPEAKQEATPEAKQEATPELKEE